jgi:hypothetical protein
MDYQPLILAAFTLAYLTLLLLVLVGSFLVGHRLKRVGAFRSIRRLCAWGCRS